MSTPAVRTEIHSPLIFPARTNLLFGPLSVSSHRLRKDVAQPSGLYHQSINRSPLEDWRYSYRSASIGLRREALLAGYSPKDRPTTSEKKNARRMTLPEMMVGQPAINVVNFAPVTPRTIPKT